MSEEELEELNQIDTNRWVYVDEEPSYLPQGFDQEFEQDYQRKTVRFNTLEGDKEYRSQYLPEKEGNSQIFYASENFYIMLRFLYALYERIIRMREVAQSK